MMNKFKEFMKKNVDKIKSLVFPAALAAALASTTPIVMAVTAEEIIGRLLGVIFDIATYIGILLLVWGIIMLVLAIRNEDADSKSRAVLFIVVAIVMVTLGSLFQPVLDLFTNITIE